MPTKEQVVTIYTWPFQWLYWPVYRALFEVESHYDVHFRLEVVPPSQGNPFPTDKEIRARAHQAWSRAGHDSSAPDSVAALALCEPERPVQHDRQIVVVWHLPHWLLARSLSTNPLPAQSVLAFPDGTTSGRFARDTLGRESIHPTPLDPQQYWEDTTSSLLACTFWPLHELNHDSNQISNPIQVRASYPGGALADEGITALMFPPRTESEGILLEPKATQGFQVSSAPLFDVVVDAIQAVMRDIGSCKGDADQLIGLVNQSFDRLVSPAGGVPPWLRQGSRMARLVATYARHDCYPKPIQIELFHSNRRDRTVLKRSSSTTSYPAYITQLQNLFQDPNHQLYEANGALRQRSAPDKQAIKAAIRSMLSAICARLSCDTRIVEDIMMAAGQDDEFLLCCGKACSDPEKTWLPLLMFFTDEQTIPRRLYPLRVEVDQESNGERLIEVMRRVRTTIERTHPLGVLQSHMWALKHVPKVEDDEISEATFCLRFTCAVDHATKSAARFATVLRSSSTADFEPLIRELNQLGCSVLSGAFLTGTGQAGFQLSLGFCVRPMQ